MIVEPFQRLILPQPGFLKGLRAVTQRHGVPLVFDEVVTGFRLAYGGAQEYYGVMPDVAAFGKVLAGGFPLAAVAGRADIMHHFDAALRGQPRVRVAGRHAERQSGGGLGGPGHAGRAPQAGRVRQALRHRPAPARGLAALVPKHGMPAQVSGEPPVFDIIFTDRPVVDYRARFTADRRRIALGKAFTTEL